MSTYLPEQLLHLWKSEQIDSQMVIGHLLQNLVAQAELVSKLNAAQVQHVPKKRARHSRTT